MVDWKTPQESPRVAVAKVREFIDHYQSIDFAHANDVLGVLTQNSEDESRINASEAEETRFQELQQTYRVRADYLASSPPKPNYPTTLVRDTAALAAALDAAQPQPVRIWSVTTPDGTSYGIFELLTDKRIAGCVKSRDQRVVHNE